MILHGYFLVTLVLGGLVQGVLLGRAGLWVWDRLPRRRRPSWEAIGPGMARVRWNGDVGTLIDVCRRRWPWASVISIEAKADGDYLCIGRLEITETGRNA